MNTNDVADLLRRLESERCQAMIAADRDRLKEILHKDLIHVHAKGQVDTYDSYFASGGFKVDYTRVARSELEVRVLGESALMTGRQLLEAVRKGSGERVRIDSRVLQVWVRQGDEWQQIAFQTTPTEFEVSAGA